MTRPTERLLWVPDPLSGLALRAKWVGAPWHYTIEWGDGTSERVTFYQPPVRHQYSAPGRYQLVVRSDLNTEHTLAETVTVRAAITPHATFTLIPGSTSVRAELERLDEHVRYRIEWGDGRTTEHTAEDLAPVHEYLPGTGAPRITLTDLPARRSASFIGPQIPDPPDPEPAPRSSWRITNPQGTGVLELHGFPAHTRVDLGRGGGWPESTPAGSVTTDASGYASRDYTLWGTPEYGWLDDWRSISIRWTDPDTGRFRQMWQPVQWCEWQGVRATPNEGCCWHPFSFGKGSPRNPYNDFALWLDWEIGTPYRVAVLSSQVPNGRWRIEWEPGVVEEFDVAGNHFRVEHDYGSNRDVWIVVTAPDGATARRRLRQVQPIFETWKDGSLAIFQAYENHGQQLGEVRDCDPYSVMRVDAGDGRPIDQMHRPSFVCPDRSGNGLRYAKPGRYRVIVYAPMSEPVSYVHDQAARGAGVEAEFDIRDEEVRRVARLEQTFHVGALHENSYTAWFEISTPGSEPVPWQIEFTLDEPARLAGAECWRGEVTVTELGQGRTRITGQQPLTPGEATRLDITVDPCGQLRVWPTDVAVHSPAPSASAADPGADTPSH